MIRGRGVEGREKEGRREERRREERLRGRGEGRSVREGKGGEGKHPDDRTLPATAKPEAQNRSQFPLRRGGIDTRAALPLISGRGATSQPDLQLSRPRKTLRTTVGVVFVVKPAGNENFD